MMNDDQRKKKSVIKSRWKKPQWQAKCLCRSFFFYASFGFNAYTRWEREKDKTTTTNQTRRTSVAKKKRSKKKKNDCDRMSWTHIKYWTINVGITAAVMKCRHCHSIIITILMPYLCDRLFCTDMRFKSTKIFLIFFSSCILQHIIKVSLAVFLFFSFISCVCSFCLRHSTASNWFIFFFRGKRCWRAIEWNTLVFSFLFWQRIKRIVFMHFILHLCVHKRDV